MDAFTVYSSPIDISCDVLHLSPPCQFFSPAHTVNSEQQDEANSAALLACGHLLSKAKPRIFTLEQTFGICHTKHAWYFNHLVQMATGAGYSVKWKVVKFHQWVSLQCSSVGAKRILTELGRVYHSVENA